MAKGLPDWQHEARPRFGDYKRVTYSGWPGAGLITVPISTKKGKCLGGFIKTTSLNDGAGVEIDGVSSYWRWDDLKQWGVIRDGLTGVYLVTYNRVESIFVGGVSSLLQWDVSFSLLLYLPGGGFAYYDLLYAEL